MDKYDEHHSSLRNNDTVSNLCYFTIFVCFFNVHQFSSFLYNIHTIITAGLHRKIRLLQSECQNIRILKKHNYIKTYNIMMKTITGLFFLL